MNTNVIYVVLDWIVLKFEDWFEMKVWIGLVSIIWLRMVMKIGYGNEVVLN